MSQLNLFDEKVIHRAPNVASVPQYSPLRYPGGKTWLYPYAKKWLQKYQPDILIEPFAGGASVGLAAGIEGLAKKVVLTELDVNIAAVWQTIMSDDAEWLAHRIRNFNFTEDNVNRALGHGDKSIKDKAFALILNNRISRGGITANGAGRFKNGENGKGLKSRWYPDTLKHRILKIAHHHDSFEFQCMDAFEVIKVHLENPKAAFFIDPPYTVAGRRLYDHSEIDHEHLFSILSKARGNILMTYDDAEEIRSLAMDYGFKFDHILMKTTHHVKKFELLISRELDWL